MARLSAVAAPVYGSGNANTRAPDLAAVELHQLLSRLRQTVLHPIPERERKLRTSEYERVRIESNLDHARTVLTKLEHDAQASKMPGRRAETQGLFEAEREMLETMADRLEDLRKMAAHDDDDENDEGDTSDGEDLLGDIIPTPSESMDSRSSDVLETDMADDDFKVPAPAPAPAPVPAPLAEPRHSPPPSVATLSTKPHDTFSTSYSSSLAEDPTQTSQTLRGRNSVASPSSTAAPPAHTSARAALFANRRKPAEPQTSTATAEALLDHQRGEQDALSDSILKMAGALKASSQRFSTTLGADKDVLDRAGDSMSKTERGMDAARDRMGMLRKMTEGKGWWGRMLLFAWVYGLMLSLLLLVFVVPKLRF